MKKQWKSVNIGQNAGNRKLLKQIFIRTPAITNMFLFEKMRLFNTVSFEKMQRDAIFKMKTGDL